MELGKEVAVPARYRSSFAERPELQAYRSAVRFVEDEMAFLPEADLAVLARRPADNIALAVKTLQHQRVLPLVIEKPPGPTPEDGLALDDSLLTAGVRHATPYLLEYCNWARDCRKQLISGQAQEISLDWRFGKTDESWKTSPREGGGVLNYYFIHLIALSEFWLGAHRLVEFQAEDTKLGQKISMLATSGSIRFNAAFTLAPDYPSFSVTLDGVTATAESTPFGAIPRRGVRDPRIDVLKVFYAIEVFSDAPQHDTVRRQRRTLEAWAKLTKRQRWTFRHRD